MRKIYLALTTTSASDWRGKVREIDELGLTEVALFPTVLDSAKRQELYQLLEKTGLEKAPFVHIRHDMTRQEMEYLMERWGTTIFNTHPRPDSMDFLRQNPDLAQLVAIENACHIDEHFDQALEISKIICMDLAHYQDKFLIQKKPEYQKVADAIKKYPIVCNHISAIKKEPFIEHQIEGDVDELLHECHTFENLGEFDYVMENINLLSDCVALELENSFAEQLKVKDMLTSIMPR